MAVLRRHAADPLRTLLWVLVRLAVLGVVVALLLLRRLQQVLVQRVALVAVAVLGLHLALRRAVLDWVPVLLLRLCLVPKRDVQEWVPVRLLRRLLWVEDRWVVLEDGVVLDLWLALRWVRHSVWAILLRLPLAAQRHNLPPMLVLDRLVALEDGVVLDRW